LHIARFNPDTCEPFSTSYVPIEHSAGLKCATFQPLVAIGLGKVGAVNPAPANFLHRPGLPEAWPARGLAPGRPGLGEVWPPGGQTSAKRCRNACEHAEGPRSLPLDIHRKTEES